MLIFLSPNAIYSVDWTGNRSITMPVFNNIKVDEGLNGTFTETRLVSKSKALKKRTLRMRQ